MKTFRAYTDSLYEAEVPLDKRSFKNIPRYSTGKPKVPFTTWLGLKGQGSQGHDGKFYGWSHRAVHGFSVGDMIKKGTIGNKYEYTPEVQKKYNDIWDNEDMAAADAYMKTIKFEPYKIKTDAEAKEMAIKFGNDVS